MIDGRVGVACCVAKERINPVGRVGEAGCVEYERLKTDGRVVVAGRVAIERVKTDGRVVEAHCEAKERTITLSGVAARIASVRCWGNRSRRRRKRKAGDSKWNEQKRKPHRRQVYRMF